METAWQKRQTLPHEEKCIFVPQRHSRTSVTLRAVCGGRRAPEEPLSCIPLGLEPSLPVEQQRGQRLAPEQQQSAPVSPQVLAENISILPERPKWEGHFSKYRCLISKESVEDIYVCPSLPTLPQLRPGLPEQVSPPHLTF